MAPPDHQTVASGRHRTFLAGERMRLAEVPPAVLAAVADLLGSDIVEIDDCRGGMSASPAAVVTGVDGTRLFVKACGASINAGTFALYRSEVRPARAVSEAPGIPSLRGTRDVPVNDPTGGSDPWIVLGFDAVQGSCPMTPWRDGDLRRVLDAWSVTSRALAARNLPDLRSGDGGLGGMLDLWDSIAVDRDDPWHDLAEHWVPRVARLRSLLDAPGVPSHVDLRSDNMVLDGDDGVWFVDWTNLQLAPAWVDPAILMIEVVASRAGDAVPAWVLDHPALADAPDGAVDAVVAAVAAFMHRHRHDIRPLMPWNPVWKGALASGLEPFVRNRAASAGG